MRKTAIAILLVFVRASLAAGKDEHRVLVLDQEWADAGVKHDAAAFARILGDRFVVSFASGKPPDKAAFHAEALKFSFFAQTISHGVILMHDDAAIIVGSTTIRPPNGNEQAESYRYTTL